MRIPCSAAFLLWICSEDSCITVLPAVLTLKDGSFAPSDKADRIGRIISPRSSPPPQRGGGGEDAPFENCAKKRRIGTTNVNLYTPFCTDVTSLCALLAIEGHTDGDGDTKPAPVSVKIEEAERGKEGGTAPAVTTTAPEQPACLVGNACCECRL